MIKSKEKIQSKPNNKTLINKLLKSCPVNVLEKLLKSSSKYNRKDNKNNNSSTSKDTTQVVHMNWIPTLGSSFDDVMVFVLSSILNKPQTFPTEYYKICINQIRSTYLFLIQHHGITGGTKK